MDWRERLNRSATGRIPLGETGVVAEVLYWAYSSHLPDNVPHRHTYFEVCQVGRYGTGDFHALGKVNELAPGDLFLARPGVLHQITNRETPWMELYWVAFSCDVPEHATGEIATLARRFADAETTLVVPDTDGKLVSLWQTLQVVASSPYLSGTGIQLTALASTLLLALLQAGSPFPLSQHWERVGSTSEPGEGGPSDSQARLAVRYIHDNLSRPLSVPEIAAQVHLSPRHLTRLLRTFTGVPPAEYIERARIDRAATLLTRTDDPIKQIAAAVGYADVQRFTRAFTRREGVPPGAFRHSGGGPIRRVADTKPPGSLV